MTTQLRIEKRHPERQYARYYENHKEIKKDMDILRFPMERTDACVAVTEPCVEFVQQIEENELLEILEVSIDEVIAKHGAFFSELAHEAGMEKESADQLRATVLDSIESEISKAGLQFTDDAKQIFLDTLLAVMKKTDEYLKENQ